MGNVAIFKGKLVKFLAKAGILVPARPDADRSLTPIAGETAFNTTANKLEVYNGTTWEQLSAGGGGTGNGLVHPTTYSTFENGKVPPLYTGDNNTVIGVNSGNNLGSVYDNTFFGPNIAPSASTASNNAAFGSGILNSLSSGYDNIGILNSLNNITSGYSNAAFGSGALNSINTGHHNIGIGDSAGYRYIGSSSYNTAINTPGAQSSLNISGTVVIGTNSSGVSAYATASNDFVLGTSSHKYKLPGRIGTIVEIGPYNTSTGQTGTIKLFELAANGTNSLALRAPDNIVDDVILTLPETAGSINQVLTTDGNGVLSWTTPSATITGPIYSKSATGTVTKVYSKLASDALANRAVNTWVSANAPLELDCMGICWSPELGIFVAVGDSAFSITDKIMTSTNGTEWVLRTAISNTWTSVCWCSELGIFVAVGSFAIMTSSDGVNWISRTSPAASWSSVCWSPELGLFMVVSSGGEGATSSDGITWTSRTMSPSNSTWTSVCWSPELGKFCAVADTGTSRISTSSDGITWTSQAISFGNWYSICWSPELGLFCAASSSGTTRIATSPDGITWTTRTISGNTRVVTWSPELGLFCAMRANQFSLYTSPDGINWTSRSIPINTVATAGCWSPELGRFIGVGRSSTNIQKVILSKDIGLYKERKVVPNYFYRSAQASEAKKVVNRWYAQSSPTNTWRSICWSPELQLFIAVSSTGTTNRVMTSPNGRTWTAQTSASNNNWQSVCWSPELGLLCAVSLTGTGNRIMTSSNGTSWNSRTSPADNDWRSVCWSPELGLFCAVASTGTGNRVMTSTDGLSWTLRTSSADLSWQSVCWSPELKLFVAVAAISGGGSTNGVMTSPDGITWTTRTASSIVDWRSVCWSPELGLFCAVASTPPPNDIGYIGALNGVMTSPDGITWTTQKPPVDTAWWSVCWSPELRLFTACSADSTYGGFMTSPDGINWTAKSNPSGYDRSWYSICWSSDVNIFTTVGIESLGVGVAISKPSNLLSEILNLKTSRLY